MKCSLYRVWDGHGRAKSATRAVDGTVERNSRAEPPRRTSQHPISGGAYSLTWSLAVQRHAAGSPVFQSPGQTDRSSDAAHGSFVWFLGSPNNVRERFCGRGFASLHRRAGRGFVETMSARCRRVGLGGRCTHRSPRRRSRRAGAGTDRARETPPRDASAQTAGTTRSTPRRSAVAGAERRAGYERRGSSST